MPIKGALDFRLAELEPSNEQPNLNQPKVNALKIYYRPHRCPRLTESFQSLFGDVLDLDAFKAIDLAMNRVEWKENRPVRGCEVHLGDYAVQ